MIQTYEPYRGIIICRSGGGYVLTTDYLAEIAKKDKEIEGLKKGLAHAPFQSYGEALRAGCDPDGAWECFKEEYRRHVKVLLEEAK